MKKIGKGKIIGGAIAVLILGLVIGLVVRFAPTVQVGTEIVEVLQPVLEAEHQSMDIDFFAEAAGKNLELETEIYLVGQSGIKYLAIEQNGHPLYVADGMLILENGKAYRLTENEMQATSLTGSLVSKNLFMQIAAIYEVVEIERVKTDGQITYASEITGEQAQELLKALKPSEEIDLSAIQEVSIKITAENKTLEQIEIMGSAELEGSPVRLAVEISDFQVLAEGEYAIPEKIENTVKTTDKESLFSITGDLFRLLQAFEKFSGQESYAGTVELNANCGMIQFEKEYDLNQLQSGATGAENAKEIEELPAIVALLCMEGDISCRAEKGQYIYELALEEDAMKQISEMIVPELVGQVIHMNRGTVVVILENNNIVSMDIDIYGAIEIFFTKIDAQIGAKFYFTME